MRNRVKTSATGIGNRVLPVMVPRSDQQALYQAFAVSRTLANLTLVTTWPSDPAHDFYLPRILLAPCRFYTTIWSLSLLSPAYQTFAGLGTGPLDGSRHGRAGS